ERDRRRAGWTTNAPLYFLNELTTKCQELPTVARAAAVATTGSKAAARPVASAGATLWFRAGFVHVPGPAVELLAVERIDGAICFGGIGHLNESEAARLAGVAVRDEVDAFHRAILFKG